MRRKLVECKKQFEGLFDGDDEKTIKRKAMDVLATAQGILDLELSLSSIKHIIASELGFEDEQRVVEQLSDIFPDDHYWNEVIVEDDMGRKMKVQLLDYDTVRYHIFRADVTYEVSARAFNDLIRRGELVQIDDF